MDIKIEYPSILATLESIVKSHWAATGHQSCEVLSLKDTAKSSLNEAW